MGAVKSKISAMDPDDVFAYSTLKIVTIRDRYLGLLHYAFQLGIFLYIVIYTIVVQQRYLKTETPFGAIRATLQEPQPWINANTIPYCNQNNPANTSNFNCTYMLGVDSVYPPAPLNSLFVTTRIKDTFYQTDPNCGSSLGVPTNFSCAPSTTANTTYTNKYFVAGIESYTVFFEHAIFGQANNIRTTNNGLKGELALNNGSATVKFNGAPIRQQGGDIFTVQDMLNACGVKTLDAPSLIAGSTQTCRYDGVLILAIVQYSNQQSHPEDLKYIYNMYTLPGSDVLAQEPSRDLGNGQSMQRTRHGVRLLFIVTGTIGFFDFPALLTALVNGFVLLKVATTVVDLLLQYVMPNKLLYKQHKYEITEDFSDVRMKNRAEQAEK